MHVGTVSKEQLSGGEVYRVSVRCGKIYLLGIEMQLGRLSEVLALVIINFWYIF